MALWDDGWIHDDETAAGSRSMDDGVNDSHGLGYMGGRDMAYWSLTFLLLAIGCILILGERISLEDYITLYYMQWDFSMTDTDKCHIELGIHLRVLPKLFERLRFYLKSPQTSEPLKFCDDGVEVDLL